MRIAAVVILYHPEPETISNIKSYCDYVEKIYVFDNTEQGTDLKDDLLNIDLKITYYHDGVNEGISRRLNAAARFAMTTGFDWLLMMDQDSCFAEIMIKNYHHCLTQYQHKDNVAMFGVDFEQRHNPFTTATCYAVISDELITSGTLLNLALFNKIGDFDEELFIDGVDHDYTIRTLIAGYTMIQFTNIQLTHHIGTLVKKASIKTLFLVKKIKNIHSPLRCYYVYRNNLYLQKKYKNTHVIDMQKLNKIALSIIKNAFWYGSNTTALIRYIFLARKDFKNNKMGK